MINIFPHIILHKAFEKYLKTSPYYIMGIILRGSFLIEMNVRKAKNSDEHIDKDTLNFIKVFLEQ